MYMSLILIYKDRITGNTLYIFLYMGWSIPSTPYIYKHLYFADKKINYANYFCNNFTQKIHNISKNI